VPEGFVSLAERLRPVAAPAPPQTLPLDDAAGVASSEDLAAEIVHELSLARLAALEAYDRAVPRLLTALAQEVLGRELALAPADVAALAADLGARFAREEPVAVIVAPSEALGAECKLRIRRDPGLRPGDLILEVRDGEVDARFAVRRANAIASAWPS
jgi:flagellar biosynthesis/type III secretory pathway protein FliH